MGTGSGWRVKRVVILVALLLSLGATVGLVAWWQGKPAGVTEDIRAGLAARHIQDPDARLRKYLEGRYGPLADAANRERVFVDFFNPERIDALKWLVDHSPEKQRQSSIDAMARWLADYRASLTPEERAGLNAQFQTPAGRAMLGRATARYNAQDVHYRGMTAPVISELLQTLNAAEQSP